MIRRPPRSTLSCPLFPYPSLFRSFLSPDGRTIAFTVESSQSPEEVWIADGELDHARRLSELNPQLGKYTFGKSRVLDFVSEDGEALQAALVLPADYQPGKRYPMVL